MKVTKENTGDLTAVLKIDIIEQDYAPKVEEQLKSYRRSANIPGFRVGMAPMQMIKKMYEIPLRSDVIEKLISGELSKYLEEENIKTLGYPLASDKQTEIDWENQKEFTFFFDIAIEPEFALDLEKVEETYYTVEPSEEMLNKFVEDIQRRFGQFSSPEKVEETDMVYGEIIELDEEGNVTEEGIKSHCSIAIDKIAQKTIQKKFIGKEKEAEIVFNLSKAFPNETDRAAMLRIDKDKAKEFKSEVKFVISSINRIISHELNEELFEKAYKGEDIKTLEDFRKRAKKDLSETYKREADRYFTNQATKEIIKNSSIELPNEFMKRWILANGQGKLTSEQIENEYQMYEESLKWQLIEAKLVEKFSLSVTKDEVKQYFKEALIGNYFPQAENETEQQTKERLEAMESVADNMIKNQEQTKQVYEYLFDQKLTQTLKENIKLKEQTISVDEFIKLVQNPTKE